MMVMMNVLTGHIRNPTMLTRGILSIHSDYNSEK